MLSRPGHALLVVALIATCLLQLAQAGEMRSQRRSVSTSNTDAAKLSRRWWFGWAGSLSPAPTREEYIQNILPEWLRYHHPADAAKFQRELERLRRQREHEIQVELSHGVIIP